MFIFETLVILCLVVLIIGSITDIRTREIPDWISYGLIFAGIGARAIASSMQGDPTYFYDGLFGFAFFFALAALLFFTGQWGGGDSKLLMGMGATIGLHFTGSMTVFSWAAIPVFIALFLLNVIDVIAHFGEKRRKIAQHTVYTTIIALSLYFLTISFLHLSLDELMLYFIANLLIVGAVYGMGWMIMLSLINLKTFIEVMKQKMEETKRVRRIVLVVAVLLIMMAIIIRVPVISIVLTTLCVAVVFMVYLWVLIRTSESCCMVKDMDIDNLTEGDWIVNDVTVGGKVICGPTDLGITKEQINTLKTYKEKGKINNVTVKEGVPFIPSFLIAFVLTILKPDVFIGLLVSVMP